MNLGFRMAFMADRAGHIAQMGLVGISVLEIFRLRLLGQFIHGAVTGETAAVFPPYRRPWADLCRGTGHR